MQGLTLTFNNEWQVGNPLSVQGCHGDLVLSAFGDTGQHW